MLFDRSEWARRALTGRVRELAFYGKNKTAAGLKDPQKTHVARGVTLRYGFRLENLQPGKPRCAHSCVFRLLINSCITFVHSNFPWSKLYFCCNRAIHWVLMFNQRLLSVVFCQTNLWKPGEINGDRKSSHRTRKVASRGLQIWRTK